MKKLMGISVIAALAVLPMAANADLTARTVTDLGAAPTVTNPTSTLATASFVTGAYDAVKTEVNGLIADTAVAEKAGGYEAIESGATVGANLVALDEAIATLSSGTTDGLAAEIQNRQNADTAIETKLTTGGAEGYAISANTVTTAGNATIGGNETVAGTLGVTGATTLTGAATLNGGATVASGTTVTASGATIAGTQGSEVTIQHAAIDADDNVITDLVTTNFKTGVVQTSVRAAESATDTALVTEKAVRDAIDTINDSASTLSGRVDTLEDQMGDTPLASTFDSATTVTAAVNELESDKQEKSASTVADGTYAHITQGNGVAANLLSLNTAVVANDTAIATINNKQIPIVTNWSSGAVTNTTISQLVTATGGGSGTSGE